MKRSILLMIGILTFCGIGLIASSAMAIDGLLANATVNFGQWDPNDSDLNNLPIRFPLDRLVDDPSGGRGNKYEMIPQTAIIKEDGSVSFIISGGHVLAVYDDGTQPGDIDKVTIEPPCPAAIPPAPPPAPTAPCSPGPAADPTAGGILSHSDGRIYRGAFLNLVRRDGVEVMQFSKPGKYLVICARKNHFVNDGMFGFVRVLPGIGK